MKRIEFTFHGSEEAINVSRLKIDYWDIFLRWKLFISVWTEISLAMMILVLNLVQVIRKSRNTNVRPQKTLFMVAVLLSALQVTGKRYFEIWSNNCSITGVVFWFERCSITSGGMKMELPFTYLLFFTVKG